MNIKLTAKVMIITISGICVIVGAGLFWSLSRLWGGVLGYLGLMGFMVLALLFDPEHKIDEQMGGEQEGNNGRQAFARVV